MTMIEEGTRVIIDVEKASDLGPLIAEDLEGFVQGEVVDYLEYGVGPYAEWETYHVIGIEAEYEYAKEQYVNVNAVTPLLSCRHNDPVYHDKEEKWICPFCYEE